MRIVLPKRPNMFLARTPVASAVLLALASPALMAQENTTLGEVIVTAQKRVESLQDVPISVDALGEQKMEELNVQNFKDYVQFLPSVTTQAPLGSGSGFNQVFMRGVATGGDGQATTSQPSVGMYLDEQPITTVQGNLDIHLYDIARVEALAGPQGTLYGASSQAGTIRIITNKPDPSAFAAGYSLETNYVDMDDAGYVAEGFVNLPMGDNAALRLVGWYVADAGWIDNESPRAPLRSTSRRQPMTSSRRTRISRGQLQHDRHRRRARGAAHQPGRELGGHAEPHVPEAGAGGLLGRRHERRPGHGFADGRALPRRVRGRRVVPGRPHDRGLDRRLDVVYSGTTWTVMWRAPRLRGLLVLLRQPLYDRLLRAAVVDDNGASSIRMPPSRTTTTTARRATRSASARRRKIAYVACSASSTRSSSTTFTSLSASSRASRIAAQ